MIVLASRIAPERIFANAWASVSAAGTNQGAIMKHVMAKAAGAADGKVVSRLVAERLKSG